MKWLAMSFRNIIRRHISTVVSLSKDSQKDWYWMRQILAEIIFSSDDKSEMDILKFNLMSNDNFGSFITTD